MNRLAYCLGFTVLLVIISGCKHFNQRSLTDEALEHATAENAKPVTEDILSFNQERKNAGLPLVNSDWKIATLKDFGPICDVFIAVLLDDQQRPVRLLYGTRRCPSCEVYIEHTVEDRKLNGKAVHWYGKPLKLFEVMEYKDNKLNGTATYFSSSGKVICSCIFKEDQPWAGRMLRRFGFGEVRLDISYKDGKKHGFFLMKDLPERWYWNDKRCRNKAEFEKLEKNEKSSDKPELICE